MAWTKKDALELQALTRQIIATQGEDALRSMAYAVESKLWLSEQFARRPLLVVAHDDQQLRIFCRSQDLDKTHVRRVVSEHDVCNRTVDIPLLALPDAMRIKDSREAVEIWMHRGGRVVEITEAHVSGKLMFDMSSLFMEVKS